MQKDNRRKNLEAGADQLLRKDQELIERLAITATKQMLTYPVLTSKEKWKGIIKKYVLQREGAMPDRFFWSHGLLAEALETWAECAQREKETKGVAFTHYKSSMTSLEQYYDAWIEKGAKIDYVDHVLNGYTLVGLYQQTGNKSYYDALQKMYQYLMDYPKDSEGSIAYRLHHATHIYADSIGMICPFLSRYGKEFQREQAVALALTQMKNFLHHGMDEQSGLPYHGYDTNSQQKLGIIGWGRAVGWLLLGLADSLEYAEPTQPDYELLCKEFRNLTKTVVAYQQETGYFTWQLSATNGPVDTSATAMICYALLKGRKIGILPETCLTVIEKGRGAILKSVREDQIGDCLSECEGFSQHPQVYGAYPWSLGPGLRMLVLYEELIIEAPLEGTCGKESNV